MAEYDYRSPAVAPAGRASRRLRHAAASITGDDTVTVGALIDRLGPASVGLVLLVVSLAAMVPIPGPIGQVFGASIALIGWQVLRGARRIYLPGWMRRARLGVGLTVAAIERFLPLLSWIEARAQPRRWLALTRTGVRRALGGIVILLGAIIALPIPLGNVVPVVALLIFSIALIERDGGAVVAGLATTLLACGWTLFLVLSGANAVLQIKAWLGW